MKINLHARTFPFARARAARCNHYDVQMHFIDANAMKIIYAALVGLALTRTHAYVRMIYDRNVLDSAYTLCMHIKMRTRVNAAIDRSVEQLHVHTHTHTIVFKSKQHRRASASRMRQRVDCASASMCRALIVVLVYATVAHGAATSNTENV